MDGVFTLRFFYRQKAGISLPKKDQGAICFPGAEGVKFRALYLAALIRLQIRRTCQSGRSKRETTNLTWIIHKFFCSRSHAKHRNEMTAYE
ncbi:MAG: hypothetical protein DRI57_03195 [Deltaproteobacteria bacterium]|nr:MAG: hypothetical protein DRI57_03195 [Deltaproteobacteria bacterium]